MQTTKRFLSLVLTVATVFTMALAMPLNSSAAERGTCGDKLTWILDDSGTLTISGTGMMENYYNGSPWYSSREKITAVKIDEGVTGIGDRAFEDCTALTGVTIPKSVTSIGYRVFDDCTSLKNIDVQAENAAYTSIDGVLFGKNKTILLCYPAGKTETEYTIPDGVTSIEMEAFRGHSYLSSITIPESVTSIGDEAFYKCTALTGVAIPGGVTSLGRYAFWGCSLLNSITIPDSVTGIDCDVFWETAYYKDTANWTGDVLYIGNHVIDANTSLSGSYNIREGTKTIATNAFSNCQLITEITVPNSVTSIGSSAFDACKSLKSVTIPDSVTYFGRYVFYGCTSLTGVTLPNSVTSITAGEFSHCESLTGITIPDGVTDIGDSAFYGCKSLTDITIPDSVTGIGGYAFSHCESLTGITIPDGVTGIGDEAFYYCTALTDITIPGGVTGIGDRAFCGCSSLTSVTIPDSVTSIGEEAFRDSAYYNEPANWTEDVLYIGNHLIKSKESLSGAYSIRAGTKTIATNAFTYCTALTSVTIPESVTGIGSRAFNYTAYYNDSANWTGDVLYIGNHLVASNTSLSGSYAVRAGTKIIAGSVFDGCASLKSVTIPDGVTRIGDEAFYYCTSLTSVTIPESVTSIGDDAFFECNGLTVKGQAGSYAQTYANENNIPFKVMCGDDNAHVYGDWAIDRAASCTEKGLKHRECEVCHIVESAEIDALGHDYDTEWTIDTPATETTPGSKSHRCKRCGDKTDITEIPVKVSVTEQFKDVVPGEWYESAVQYALDNSLFFGVSDNEFAPDVAMNRAMLVTVLWRVEGKPEVSAENTFDDVPADEWYTNAVIWASENGVVYGTDDGKFSPEDSITREQMAAILYRYANNKGYDVTASTDLGTYPDSSDASQYARTALSWACGAGLIFGSDGKLFPQDGATRAQVAAILMRYTQKVVQ